MSGGDSWATPPDLYREICERWNGGRKFDLDACATEENTKAANAFILPYRDGLANDWAIFGNVWVNPPYSNWKVWARKAWEESQRGAFVAFLTMAATAEAAFWEYLSRAELVFIRGRIQFVPPPGVKCGSPAFGSVLALFRPHADYAGRPPVSWWWPQAHQDRARRKGKRKAVAA